MAGLSKKNAPWKDCYQIIPPEKLRDNSTKNQIHDCIENFLNTRVHCRQVLTYRINQNIFS